MLYLLGLAFSALGVRQPLAPTNDRPKEYELFRFEGSLVAVTAKDLTLRAPNGSVHTFRLNKALEDGTYLKDPNGGYDHTYGIADSRYSYRIGDIRKYDILHIYYGVKNKRFVCEHICIYRRYTGRVPPTPGRRRSYGNAEYHNVVTDMSYFELLGRLPPKDYVPSELPPEERDPEERRDPVTNRRP